MSNFAAPNMTALSYIGGNTGWDAALPSPGFNKGQQFTIEAWIRFGEPSGSLSAQILVKPGEFSFAIDQGLVAAGWASGAWTVKGVTPLLPNTWYHVAAIYDGTQLSVYLDGGLEATAAYAGPGMPPTGSNFRIGSSGQTNDSCDIWDLTLYNVARDAADENAAPWVDLVPSPGLVAHFDFSTAPAKETVAQYPMTPVGGAGSFTVAPGIRLDGNSAGIAIARGQAPTLPSVFSVSAWVMLTGGGSQTVFACTQDTAWLRLGFEGAAQGGLSLVAAVGVFGVAAPVNINLGDWHNVALTCDGTNLTLYLDGAQVATGALPGSMPAIAAPFWSLGYDAIGGNKGRWLSGGAQWLSVWSRCLTAADVVFQQYGSVTDDDAILADVSLDAVPAIELVSSLSLDLGGTAAIFEQRVPVTAWSPPPAQLDPQTRNLSTVARRRPTAWAIPGGPAVSAANALNVDAVVAEGLGTIDSLLTGHDPLMVAQLKADYESRVRGAFATLATNPGQFAAGRWVREGNDDVYRHRDAFQGELELFRAEADALSDCQKWWLSFIFTLLMGIMNLFCIKLTDGKTLTEWVEKKILGDVTVMGALKAIWDQSPTFTGFTVVKLLAGVYQLGLLRNFLWFVAYQIGYWGLAKLFARMIALVTPAAPAGAVIFATNAAVLATQLALQIVGAPNVPGYSQSCGSECALVTA